MYFSMRSRMCKSYCLVFYAVVKAHCSIENLGCESAFWHGTLQTGWGDRKTRIICIKAIFQQEYSTKNCCFNPFSTFSADFFIKYVDKKVPVVIRGAAKQSPAFLNWNDAYFRKNPDIVSMHVSVDRDKKELPNITDYRHMKFKAFLDRYKSEELYLVDGVKPPLQYVFILL